MGTFHDRARSILLAIGVTEVLAACDPAYEVGARQYLAPVPATADSAQRAPRDQRAGANVDIPRTADCVDSALHRLPSISYVQRLRTDPKLREADMNVGIRDSALGPEVRYASLTLHAWRNEPAAADVLFHWIGTARTYPLQEQRGMVRAATGLLRMLRTACLPTATDSIVCIAQGLGGRKACVD